MARQQNARNANFKSISKVVVRKRERGWWKFHRLIERAARDKRTEQVSRRKVSGFGDKR